MKIELIKHIFNKDIGYKYRPFDYCCEKLKGNPIINLVNEFTYNDYYSHDEYPFPCVAVWQREIIREWDEEWDNDTYYRINYCPFCGEAIELFIAEERDLSNIYSELQKQRDTTWRKCNRVDNKKEANKLYRAVHELDNKINWFHELYEWDSSVDSNGGVCE